MVYQRPVVLATLEGKVSVNFPDGRYEAVEGPLKTLLDKLSLPGTTPPAVIYQQSKDHFNGVQGLERRRQPNSRQAPWPQPRPITQLTARSPICKALFAEAFRSRSLESAPPLQHAWAL